MDRHQHQQSVAAAEECSLSWYEDHEEDSERLDDFQLNEPEERPKQLSAAEKQKRMQKRATAPLPNTSRTIQLPNHAHGRTRSNAILHKPSEIEAEASGGSTPPASTRDRSQSFRSPKAPNRPLQQYAISKDTEFHHQIESSSSSDSPTTRLRPMRSTPGAKTGSANGAATQDQGSRAKAKAPAPLIMISKAITASDTLANGQFSPPASPAPAAMKTIDEHDHTLGLLSSSTSAAAFESYSPTPSASPSMYSLQPSAVTTTAASSLAEAGLRCSFRDAQDRENSVEGAIRVAVRLRVMNQYEMDKGDSAVVEIKEGGCIMLKDFNDPNLPANKPDLFFRSRDTEFRFDAAFGPLATQNDVYDATTKDLLNYVLAGVNGTVFAYGATGSGKTFTMIGTDQQPGVASLLVKDLFSRLESTNVRFEMKCFFVEIYKEQIRDLLSTDERAPVAMREDPDQGIMLQGMVEKTCYTPRDVLQAISQGGKSRSVDSHCLNSVSSRSHAVLQIALRLDTNTDHDSPANFNVCSKLTIIDLAGSESGKKAQTNKKMREEGATINKSLLALGNCINALAHKTKKGLYVPYRDSKLTRMLKDSLSGMSRTVMIANISPASGRYSETRETLLYAHRAANITAQPLRDLGSKTGDLHYYKELVRGLQAEVAILKKFLSERMESPQAKALSPSSHDINPNNSNTISNSTAARSSNSSSNSSSSSAHPVTTSPDYQLFDKARTEILNNTHEFIEAKKSFAEIQTKNALNREHIEALAEEIKQLTATSEAGSGERDLSISKSRAEQQALQASISDNLKLQQKLEERMSLLSAKRQDLRNKLVQMQENSDMKAGKFELLYSDFAKGDLELSLAEIQIENSFYRRIIEAKEQQLSHAVPNLHELVDTKTPTRITTTEPLKLQTPTTLQKTAGASESSLALVNLMLLLWVIGSVAFFCGVKSIIVFMVVALILSLTPDHPMCHQLKSWYSPTSPPELAADKGLEDRSTVN